jgi:hypothetical protein
MSRLGVDEDIADLPSATSAPTSSRRYNFDQAWESRVDAFARVSAHIVALIGARRGAPVIALRS